MLFFLRRRRRRRVFRPIMMYVGTFLCVFMAAWMIVQHDPGFQARPPVYGYIASFAVALLVVLVEVLRNHVKRKRALEQEQALEPLPESSDSAE